MNSKLIKTGFTLAAAMNFSVIIFSRGFTNVTINQADPVVMSNFGLLMIVVWGLAYLASAFTTTNLKWLAGVFAIEKLVYVIIWIKWILNNSLEPLFAEDLFAGLFFSIYGLNDLLFMVFFSLVFLVQYSRTKNKVFN